MKYEFETPVLTKEQLSSVRNPDVAWIQAWLNANCGTKLEVDGVWGTSSRAEFIHAMTNRNANPILPRELLSIAKDLGDTNTKRIKAVAVVESGGSGGWFNSGLPKILYERHKFWEWTTNVSNRVVSWYSNPNAGDYTMDANKNGINDSWEKLSLAIGKDPLAALSAISIGKFQVLGRYYRECGYNHPIEMLCAASRDEYAHYAMLRDYILNVAKLKEAFLALSTNPNDNRAFARGYNGKAYKRYEYHIKLAKAMA